MPCSNRSRGIALPIRDAWARRGGQRNALVVLTPVKGPIHVVGPRHHGMARPHVADSGTASDREGTYE